jgi:osmotically-inducible protein OsmY
MSRRHDERDERSFDQDYGRGRRGESDYERNRGSYGASRAYNDYNRERDYGRDYGASGIRDYDREGSYSGSYGGTTGRDYERDYGQRDYSRGYSGGETNRGYGNYGREVSSGGSYGGGSYESRYGRGDYERGYGNREQYGNRGGEERGWWDRASDEVSSWFGDEEAERRRRMDEQRAGRHRGRGPRGYRRSDDRIKEDVNDRLSDHDYLDASDVEVSVDDSEVTLSGTVNGRYEKRLAEDIAESVSGVTHVQNNLRISQSRYGALPTGTTGMSATGTSATGISGTSTSGAAAGTSATGTQRTK